MHVLKPSTSSEQLEHGKRGDITPTSYGHAWVMPALVGGLSGENIKRVPRGQFMGPTVNHPIEDVLSLSLSTFSRDI